MKFLGLMEEFSDFEKSKAVIVPVPYEKTTSYMKGTKEGPNAILKASFEMEPYDIELKKNIAEEIGISTLDPADNPEKIKEAVEKVKDKFPIFIGGEHTVTYFILKELLKGKNNVSILHLDAHADLYDEFEGKKESHITAMRRVFEICPNIVSAGIRTMNEEEEEFAQKNNIPIYLELKDEIISKLKEKVYVTIDLDFFDPSLMPAVGTPEPGGFQWKETLEFLKKVFKERDVIGCDVVELCPQKGNIVSDYTAAKLVYKLIGHRNL